jgi:hypothetical protein
MNAPTIKTNVVEKNVQGADILTPASLAALPEYSHGTEALTRKENVAVKSKPRSATIGSSALRSWTLFWINANNARSLDGAPPKLMPSTVILSVASALWVTAVMIAMPYFVNLLSELGVHLLGVEAWLMQPPIHVIAGALMLVACGCRLSEAWHGLASKVLFGLLFVHVVLVTMSMVVPLMSAIGLLTQ